MPTYVFSPESFLEFVRKHLGEGVAVVVSSDVLEVEEAELESHIGGAKHNVVKFAISDVAEGEIDDTLQAVIGNESVGWWVVADTLVNQPLPDTGNGQGLITVPVPSVVVWFVQPDGAVRWQRRITPSGAPAPDIRQNGPFFRAATLATVNGTETLAMTLSNLEPDSSVDANLTMVFLDDANNFNVGAETLTVRQYSSAPLWRSRDQLLIQTSDPVNGVIDTVPDDGYLIARQTTVYRSNLRGDYTSHQIELTKVDRNGAEEWSLEIAPESRHTDYYFSSAAQTFPASTPSWIWVSDFYGRLWRIDLSGQVSLTCEINGYEIKGYDRVPAIQAAGISGAELRILARRYDRNDERYHTDELIVDENCQILSATPLNAAVPDRHIPPPPSRDNSRYVANISVAAGPGGRLTMYSSDKIFNFDEAGVHLTEIDEFGNVTRVLSTTGFFAPTVVYDAAGQLWMVKGVSQKGDSLLELAADGSTTSYKYTSTDPNEPNLHLLQMRAAPAGGLETLWHNVVWRGGPSPEQYTQLVTISANGAASARSLRPLMDSFDDVTLLYNFDLLGGAHAFWKKFEPAEFAYYGDVDNEGWLISIPRSSNSGEIAEILPVDVVIAHDGGLVILLDIRGFQLPSPFADPPGTYGDADIALLKINAQGRPQWLRIYGAAGNEIGSKLVRTATGYAVLASSDSFDAVTPGTDELWVLQTGVDGHIAADAAGNDLCQACLGSISGQALLDLLPLEVVAVPALPSATPTTLVSKPGPVFEVSVPEHSSLPSVNTARQCLGDATDIQEPAVVPAGTGRTLAVAVFTDGTAMGSGNPVGGLVTSAPTGINCDILAGSDCTEAFAEGSIVTLSAVAREGYRFDRWESDNTTAACNGNAGAVVDVSVDSGFECRAYFVTAATGTEDVAVNFDSTVGRVVDVNTGLLDCTANCTTPLPVAESPIRLRAINGATSLAIWVGCDSEIPDPDNPTGPYLCEIDITNGPRMIDAIFQ